MHTLLQNSYSGQKLQDFPLKNPTADPETYWAAPAQLPTQFAPLSHTAVRGQKLSLSFNDIVITKVDSCLLEDIVV